MRIVHHSTMIEHGSGMMAQVADFVRAEQRMGLDSGVICTQEANKSGKDKNGKTLEAFGVQLKSWDWAYECDPKDTVHVSHSHPPINIATLKNLVTVLHGTPEHVIFRQLWTKTNEKHIPFTTCINLIQQSTMAVTLIPRHAQFWEPFAHKDNIVAVDGGVDLEGKFKPAWMLSEMEKAEYTGKKVLPVFPFSAKPSIFCCESFYEIKVPTVVLMAIKRIVKTLPSARLSVINLKGVEKFWTEFIRKGYMDMYFDMWIADKVQSLETYYRGASIYASPVLMGDMSRCGMEALSCGTPVVSVKSDWNPVNEWSCAHEPNAFADKIIEVYHQMQGDEQTVREKARKYAENNYDINTTVKQMEERVYNKLVGS
jgi:hypothetical protein